MFSSSCLGASASFGRLAFPLFLEKLYAGSPATKVGFRDLLLTPNSGLSYLG